MQKNENPTSRYMYSILFSDFVHLENIFLNSMKITVFYVDLIVTFLKEGSIGIFLELRVFSIGIHKALMWIPLLLLFLNCQKLSLEFIFFHGNLFTLRGTRQGSPTRLAIKNLNSRLPQTAVKIDPH